MSDKLDLTEAEWRERLTPEQSQALREGGLILLRGLRLAGVP